MHPLTENAVAANRQLAQLRIALDARVSQRPFTSQTDPDGWTNVGAWLEADPYSDLIRDAEDQADAAAFAVAEPSPARAERLRSRDNCGARRPASTRLSWTAAARAAITCSSRRGRRRWCVCVCTRESRRMRRTSRPRCIQQRERLEAFVRSQEGWRVVAHEEDRATGTKLDRPGLQAALAPRPCREGRSAARLPRRPPLAEGPPAGAVGGGARSARRLVAVGDGAVRYRCGRGSDDVADAGGVRGVRARDDRRPRHRRPRAPRETRPLGDRRSCPSAIAAPLRRTLSPDDREAPVVRRARSTSTPVTGSGRRRSRACSPTSVRRRRRAVGSRRRCSGCSRTRPTSVASTGAARASRPARSDRRRRDLRAGAAAAAGAGRGSDAAARQPLRVPALRGDPLWPLQARLHRHERHGQRRPLPLLRLLGPAEARPQRLRRRTPEPGQARSRRLHPAHRDVPKRRPDRQVAAARLRRASRRPAGLKEQRRTVAEEIRRADRALERYYQAFEAGDLEPGQFKTRLADLDAKLDTLRDQEHALAAQLADPAETSTRKRSPASRISFATRSPPANPNRPRRCCGC